MKHFLIVVDMQKDFVDGALGTPEAQAIVGNVIDKIRNFEGQIFATLDTHTANYLQSAEGKKLPVPHCVKGTPGWKLDNGVAVCLEQKGYTPVEKLTFGSVLLPRLIYQAAEGEPFTLELVGLCTDICVVSNALMLKANFPEMEISVDSSCCAGVTPETHAAALATMACCQINVK
ncbi:MAG TPA: amidase [Clostridiales bacterium]|nr:amidase [Clostridiales bacterium]